MAKYRLSTLTTVHLQDLQIGGGGDNGNGGQTNGFPINGEFEMYCESKSGETYVYIIVPNEIPETWVKGVFGGAIDLYLSKGYIYAGYYPNTSIYIQFNPQDFWFVDSIWNVRVEFVHEDNFTLTDGIAYENMVMVKGIIYEQEQS